MFYYLLRPVDTMPGHSANFGNGCASLGHLYDGRAPHIPGLQMLKPKRRLYAVGDRFPVLIGEGAPAAFGDDQSALSNASDSPPVTPGFPSVRVAPKSLTRTP